MSTINTIELEVGDVVDGRYRICRRLGRGGMGTVYEAQQIKLQRQVALKVLRPEFASREMAAKRFGREAKAVSSIDHHNVVAILDFGHLPTGELYYTMELLQGRDLSQLLRETGALPWSRAGWIILQVVRAFVAIHARGILHRDIKPANCYLLDPKPGNEPDYVKILDFGIANLQDQEEKATALTGTSDIIGSVLYMAPEQVEGKPIDARTDIYSLGVMMYEILTGQVPFRDPHIFKVMIQHMTEVPRPPRELVPEIPPEVEALILRAMAKAPEDRFQTMADIEAALAPLVEGIHTVPRPAASVSQRRWAMPLVGVVLVLVVAIIVMRWIEQDALEGAATDDPPPNVPL
jgi:serine/threonine protein kinase